MKSPSWRSAGSGSSLITTPIRNCSVGARYCSIPSVVSGTRLAAPANSSRGVSVAIPAAASSSALPAPSWPNAASPVALIVDRRWQDAYHGRTLHPVSEAELARVTGSGTDATVTRVGKRLVAAEEAAGEFTGLARFAPAGAAALRAVWTEALARGLDTPFGAAATLRNAYLSDGLNAIAARGVALGAVLVDGGWREIDTEQDLASAERNVDAWRA